MHISVWSHDCNPTIDPRTYRRSRKYCETEIAEGRAYQINPSDISAGIHLYAPQVRAATRRTDTSEHRGSPESQGCVTARESHLSADYRGRNRTIGRLSAEYESRLERHILAGRKGTPTACAVIAARVKVILSDPGHAAAEFMRQAELA